MGNRQRDRDLALLIFTSPWLIGFLVLSLAPAIYGLYLACTTATLSPGPGPAASLATALFHLKSILSLDAALHASLLLTLTYAAIAVPLRLGLALFAALLLHTPRRSIGLLRSIFFLPAFLGEGAATAGLFHALWPALPVTGNLILLTAWQFGASMLILLAAIRGIPFELYESALIDGAGRLRRLFSLTIPELRGGLALALLLELANAITLVGPALILGSGRTSIFGTYLFEKAFLDGNIGYAAALSLLPALASMVLAGLVFLTRARMRSRRDSDEGASA